MSKYKLIFTLLASTLTMTALADSIETFTIVKTNGSTVPFSSSGLVIAYDDYAHVQVTNNETTATIDLIDVDYMCLGVVDVAPASRGDVNNDGEISIADMNTLVNVILGGDADPSVRFRADVNGDSEISIADINTLIDIILNQ